MPEQPRVARRLTQYDIARQVGVSQTTVSQVLRNPQAANIPEETRRRVLEAAQALGYVPDRLARSLRTGKTHIIAAVIPDITNPFYPALVRGIQDEAEAHDYHVATYNTDGDPAREARILEVVLQARLDGLILASFHLDRRQIDILQARGLPMVLFADLDEYEPFNLDAVGTDARGSAAMATEYLIGRGYRHIAMLTSSVAAAGVSRAAGFRQALAAHGLEIDESRIIWCRDFTEKAGYAGMEQVAKLRPLPSAIFAASDQLALGALQAAHDLGLLVPRDVALMGIDDIYSARLVSPALTTIAQDQDLQGRSAACFLLDRIAGTYQGPARHLAIPYRLVVRESA
jgi:LacI family transcriptional regulator